MLTTLDTINWDKVLFSGNAQFLEISGIVYVVSNVRGDASFIILQSAPAPPAAGIGSHFSIVATFTFTGFGSNFGYNFGEQAAPFNSDFDPVVAYDTTGPQPVIHIIGTRDNPSAPHLVDLIKFTFNLSTQVLSSPIVLTSGSTVRNGYDMVVLANGHKIISVSVLDASMAGAEIAPLFQADITALSLAGNLLSVTAVNQFTAGQLVVLNGLTNASFLNGLTVQVLSTTAGFGSNFGFNFGQEGLADSFLAVAAAGAGFNYNFGNNFGRIFSTADSGTAIPIYSGENLLAFELDKNDAYVANTLQVIASSPDRSGDTYSSTSLVTSDGVGVDLYFEAHPKEVTFADQIFTLNSSGRNQATPASITVHIPTSNPYTVTVPDAQNFVVDEGVVFVPGSQPLMAVNGTPGAGQYAVNVNTGTYTFSPNDAQGFSINFGEVFGGAQQIRIDYGVLPLQWQLTPTLLTSFSGRYTDDRLTVLGSTGFGSGFGMSFGSGSNRYLCLNYWTQSNHPEGIVGNVMLGTMLSPGEWFFHPVFGSTVGGSLVEATLSLDETEEIYMAYLLEPFDELAVSNPVPAWPLHVASVDPVSLAITDQPGFYNQQLFTWLRGTKSLVDGVSHWAAVGERATLITVENEIHTIPSSPPYVLQVNFAADTPTMNYWENIAATFSGSGTPLTASATSFPATTYPPISVPPLPEGEYYVERDLGLYAFSPADAGKAVAISYTYVGIVLPIYVSEFNVPPVVALSPTSAIVYRGAAGYQFVNPPGPFTPGPFVLNASNTTDADDDPIEFVWTENDPNLVDIFLTPEGSTATLTVERAIGGDAQSFEVGVAAIDLFADGVTPRHPALPVTSFQISGQALTVSVANDIGVTEQVMLYGFALQAPAAPVVEAVSSSTPAATITNIAIAANVLTVTADNNFVQGENVVLSGLTNAFFLNGQVVAVNPSGLFATQFQAVVDFPDYPSAADTGTAVGPAGATYYFEVTYLNVVGETNASAETMITTANGQIPQLVSPAAEGDPSLQGALAYNVYAATSSGMEQLQNIIPIPLGTSYQIPLTGLINAVTPPSAAQNTALLEFLNDQVLTVASASPTQLTMTAASFLPVSYVDTVVTGSLIPQNQFLTCAITVPFNAPPVITFPSPAWLSGNISAQPVPRNTSIEITPDTITDATTQLPVQYAGISDIDDVVTYDWQQLGGTPVSILRGTTSASLNFETNGVNVNGETLEFSLTLSDGVNPSTTAECYVVVAAYNFTDTDTHHLARAIFDQMVNITAVQISDNTLTVITNAILPLGAQVTFYNLANADFLNGQVVTISDEVLGFGSNFGASFGVPAFIAPYPFEGTYPLFGDSGLAAAPAPIAARNTVQTWSPLDISAIYSDLKNVKRTSVIDGTDRYIVISSFSVLVYGGIRPNELLLRKLLTPQQSQIVDAVHTEQDYTLVLDNMGNLFRYSQAPLINTDSPDTQLQFSNISTFTFNAIYTTYSFAGERVLALSGVDGCLLVQVSTDTLQIQGFLEISTESNLLYGADKVQFVRTAQVENLRSGQVLLGTVANVQATILSVQITNNALIIGCNNEFAVDDEIDLEGLTNATFLNGLTVKVVSLTPQAFVASYAYNDYPLTSDTGTATALNHGKTYETLIDLSQGQIIGTWDASKLKNQFVNTGEILFNPDSAYSGFPLPPGLNQPIAQITPQGTLLLLSWIQSRADLVYGYTVQVSTDGVNFGTLQQVNSGTVQQITVSLSAGNTYYFRVQALSQDGISGFSNITSITI